MMSSSLTNFNIQFARAGFAYEDIEPPPPKSPSSPVPVTHPPAPEHCLFSFKPLQESEVLSELLCLDTPKSPSLDALESFFLKAEAHIISAPITHLFNLSLQTQDWKSASVTPLFKGGDKLDLNCYRSISVLPCLAKLFKRIVNKQLTHHLKSNNILTKLSTLGLHLSLCRWFYSFLPIASGPAGPPQLTIY